MPFANIKQPKQYESSFKKTEFIELVPGMNMIRILDEEAYDVEVHYIGNAQGGINVKCLGDDCPVCKNNKKIILENPDDFRSIKGYSPRRQIFIVNVLDRSQVKTCPNEACKKEVKALNGIFPTQCPKCGAIITNQKSHQLNQVKILSKGKQLFSQLETLSMAMNDEQGNPIPLTKYDIALSVSGTNKKESPSPIPYVNANDVVTVEPDALFDRVKSVLELTVEEIMDLQRGVSLKDIFTARKSTTEKATDLETVKDEEVAKIKNDIESMFDN